MGTIDLSAFLPVTLTTTDATAIRNAFTTIQTLVNGNIDNSNIASGAAIVASKLSGYPSDPTLFLSGAGTWLAPTGSGGGTSNLPTGALVPYGAASAPTGFLIADGSAVSTTTYATLFGVVGTTWNTGGEGVGNFRLPDLRGRVPVGKGTNASVSSLAANDAQAVGNRRPHHRTTNSLTGGSIASASGTLPNHVHSYTDGGHNHGTPNSNDGSVSGNFGSYVQTDHATSNTGATNLASTGLVMGNPTTSPGITVTGTTSAPAGSIGTNNANDFTDAPSFLVVQWLIKT